MSLCFPCFELKIWSYEWLLEDEKGFQFFVDIVNWNSDFSCVSDIWYSDLCQKNLNVCVWWNCVITLNLYSWWIQGILSSGKNALHSSSCMFFHSNHIAWQEVSSVSTDAKIIKESLANIIKGNFNQRIKAWSIGPITRQNFLTTNIKFNCN